MKYLVRHGSTRILGEFEPLDNQVYQRMQRVVLQTPRGTESGVILCEADERAKQFLVEPSSGKIVRAMTPHDLCTEEKKHQQQVIEYDVAVTHIQRLKLQMDLVDVEHLLGDERIVFYFLVRPPEKRVDFRELVKELAREFHTRIEMRQIGIRDEARLLADYGDCGKPVCCNTHLTVLPPVSMRMAKLQKSTLDPTKISGRCGRLKCCLRYEYDVYEDLLAELPPIGAMIVTKQGKAKVLAHEILARKLLVMMEDNRRIMMASTEVLSVMRPSHPPPPRRDYDSESSLEALVDR
jgi:cell fate regulator YaaT (PSP1 superfamily)